MAPSKITDIADRYEMTFLIFHRDHSEVGRIYHCPSKASKRRFARTIIRMFARDEVKCSHRPSVPRVFRYDIARVTESAPTDD